MTRPLYSIAACPLLTACAAICVVNVCGCWFVASNQVEHANVNIDVSPDSKTVVFSSPDGDLFLLDISDLSVRRLTNSAVEETSPAFSPDGKSLLYTADKDDSQGTSVFACTLDGKRVEQLTHDSDVSDSFPRYSPDGSKIVFARAHRHREYSMGGWTWDDWDVYVMDTNGDNLRRVTELKHYGINKVLFSRDGRTVFYSAEKSRGTSDSPVTIFAASLDSPVSPTTEVSNPNSAAKHYAWASEPALSPNGKYFVFISDREQPFHYDLILMNRKSGASKSLGATRMSRYNRDPVITADGKKVFFLAAMGWNASSRPIFSLWSMDIDGRNAKQLADSGLFTDPISWEPGP